MIRNTLIFLAGVFIGAAALTIHYYFEIAPPAPQETTRLEVGIARLMPEDQWLSKARFQIVPLDGVESTHKYAILLITPPAEGIHVQPVASATLDMTASTAYWTTDQSRSGSYSFPEGIQPVQIKSSDFGDRGDQVVVKFIDELINIRKGYNSSEKLMIGSTPL